jgi:pimeloyl-ACP methyl ester carboxylesterase
MGKHRQQSHAILTLALATWSCSQQATTTNALETVAPIAGVPGPVVGAGPRAGMAAMPTAGRIATAPTAGTVAAAGSGAAEAGSAAGAGAVSAAGSDASSGTGAAGVGAAGAAGDAASDVGTDPLPPLADAVALPLVFVHGFAGSAQQYYSQKLRFVANGYPADRIVAYEHDGAGFDVAGFAAGLGEVVDQAIAKFGTSQVYLAAHSRGGGVVGSYLGTAQNAAKVAKYVALDALGACDVPTTIPCISLTQAMLSQKHVEVATSLESFKLQYNHFVGEEPKVVDTVRQRGLSVISGRAVNFPANTGRNGATLTIREIDGTTGARTAAQPIATFTLAADGNWGPANVDPDKFYEFELSSPEGGATGHFYFQRFLRDSDLVRLLSGGPDSDSAVNTYASDKHVALVVSRMREWTATDQLEISTTTPSSTNAAPVNVNNATAAARDAIAFHLHDAEASPGDTTLAGLPYFSTAAFQYGMDVFMPAANPPTGTVTLRQIPRGETDRPQIINVPNWPSSTDRISILFNDFAQD